MSAILDRTRTYRYRLTRPAVHDGKDVGPPILWVALNPSTADETADDPTIRKCSGFQNHWFTARRGDLVIVNLFALRATDPRALRIHPDPVGPLNEDMIELTARETVAAGGAVVAAWGADRFARERAIETADLLSDFATVWCLGTTKDGSPRHPLYVPYSQPLVPWEGYA